MIYAEIKENGRISVFQSTVSDSVEFETIKFEFPESWNGFTKTAVFRGNNETLSVILNSDSNLCTGEDECYIPYEVIKAPSFTVSVFGSLKNKRATTTKAEIRVTESGYGTGDAPAEPTPTQYEQLVSIANATKQVAQSVRTDADNGVFKGDKGEKGDKGDKGDPFVYSDFTDEQLALLKGAKGDTGDTGPRGLQGEKGDTGEQGVQGVKGDKGDKGDKGVKGDAFTYADFTDEQLAGLKGEKGDTGEVSTDYLHNNFANVIKKSAYGDIISVNDVSPIKHNLKIQLSSDSFSDFSTLSVNCFDRNIFDPQLLLETGFSYNNGWYSGNAHLLSKYSGGIPLGNFIKKFRCKVSFKAYNMNSEITSLLLGITYTDGTNETVLRVSSTEEKKYQYITRENKQISHITITYYENTVVYLKEFYIGPIIEEDYLPYKGVQSAFANNTGVVSTLKSIAPNLIIVSDSDDVNISCEYIADTKNYIDSELQKLKAELLTQ